MGNALKILRQNRAWTQEQAAKAFGMSLKGYIKKENGEREMSASQILTASKIYGVSASVVLEQEPPPTPAESAIRSILAELSPEQKEAAVPFFQSLLKKQESR